jgi:hypothetical protein
MGMSELVPIYLKVSRRTVFNQRIAADLADWVFERGGSFGGFEINPNTFMVEHLLVHLPQEHHVMFKLIWAGV